MSLKGFKQFFGMVPTHPNVIVNTSRVPNILYLGLTGPEYDQMKVSNTFKAESPRRIDLIPSELVTKICVIFYDSIKMAQKRAGDGGVILKINGHKLGASHWFAYLEKFGTYFFTEDIPNADKYIVDTMRKDNPHKGHPFDDGTLEWLWLLGR